MKHSNKYRILKLLYFVLFINIFQPIIPIPFLFSVMFFLLYIEVLSRLKRAPFAPLVIASGSLTHKKCHFKYRIYKELSLISLYLFSGILNRDYKGIFHTFLVKNNQFIFQCLWYVFLIDKLLVSKVKKFSYLSYMYTRNFNTLFHILLQKPSFLPSIAEHVFIFLWKGKKFSSIFFNIHKHTILWHFSQFPMELKLYILRICLFVYCQINFKLAKLTSNFVVENDKCSIHQHCWRTCWSRKLHPKIYIC